MKTSLSYVELLFKPIRWHVNGNVRRSRVMIESDVQRKDRNVVLYP
jgi:hypothetical protein